MKKLLIGLVFIVSFFTIPFLFPSNELVFSTSYDVGFNNKIGVLLVGVSIITFVLMGRLSEQSYNVVFSSDNKDEKMKYNILLFSSFCVFAYILFVGYCICGNSLVSDVGESTYFLPHIYDIIAGKMPYKDFVFYYGPMLAYFPYWAFLIIPGHSVLLAYLLSLFFFHLLGLFALFDLINRFNLGIKEKKWLFFVLFFATFPTAFGLNYQLLRFVLPFWSFTRMYNFNKSEQIYLFPLSIIGCLSISPEIGVVYFVVSVAFCLLQWWYKRESYYILLLFVNSFFTSCFIYAFLPMFSMFSSFGAGMMNFPYVLSLHLILFFVSVMIVAFNAGKLGRNIKTNIFEICFILLSFGMLPACLGRCDPGHVLYNGLFILPLAYIFTNVKKVRINILKMIMGIIWACMIQVWLIFNYTLNYLYSDVGYKHKDSIISLLEASQFDTNRIAKLDARLDSIHNSNIVTGTMLKKEFKSLNKKIAFPFIDGGIDLLIYIDMTKMDICENLYITRMSMSGNSKDVLNTLNEIDTKKIQYLLLHKNFEKMCNQNGDYSTFPLLLFYSPLSFETKKNGKLVYKPLVDYILVHYKEYHQIGNYLIYKRDNY